MADAEIIITRRRKWTPEVKAALLSEANAEGGRVSLVARRHRLSESLFYNWRSVAKAAAETNGPEPERANGRVPPISIIQTAWSTPWNRT